MKASLLRQLLLALVLAGMATWLFLHSQPPDQRQHAKVLLALADMRLADARLSETLLRSHSGLLASYDPLVAVSAHNEALMQRARTLLESHAGGQDDGQAMVDEALRSAAVDLQQRLALSEDFKTVHAVMRSSVLQISPLAARVNAAAAASGEPWAQTLSRLTDAVTHWPLSHYVSGDHTLFGAAYNANRDLQALLPELPAPVATLVGSLLQHTMVMLAYRDELTGKLDAALGARITDSIVALERAHLDAYALASENSGAYRSALYAAVVLLLLQSAVLALGAARYTTRLQRREAALQTLHEAASNEHGDVATRTDLLLDKLRDTLSLRSLSFAWGMQPPPPANHRHAPLQLPVTRTGEVCGWLSSSGHNSRTATADREFLALVARWLSSELDSTTTAAALRAQTERARTTLDSIADAVLTIDAGGVIDYANPAAQRITGRSQETLLGRAADEVLVLVCEQGDNMRPVHDCLRTRATQSYDEELELVRAQGGLLVTCTVSPLAGGGEQEAGCVVVMQDARAHRDLRRELLWRASHDTVTGALNRGGFEPAVLSLLETGESGSDAHVLMMIDIDQFRVINDLHGRAAGDNLLRAISTNLRRVMPDEALLARLDGDTFALLLSDTGTDAAHSFIEQAREALAGERLASDDGYFEITAAYGIAPSGGVTTPGDWLAAAESACNAARALGHDRVSVLRVGDEALARRRSEMQWVSRLNEAIEDSRLVLYEQPVVAADDPGAEPSHWEVLLRLQDVDGRIVPPGEFLPVAESYGLIGRVDRYVVTRVLERLERDDLPKRRYAVNLSGVSLSDPALVGYLHNLLADRNLPPGALCFEITETAAVSDLDNAARLIEALRALGCTFALDDFGAGLSSFNYLRRLPVDYLKIDGAFVRGIDEDRINRGMVEAIHRVGQVMGIRTIGEFVESELICAALAEIGVDYAQGYWTGKPAPVAWARDDEGVVAKSA